MYRKEILKGIDFLASVQNSDGGIPGMKCTDPSACWTTAEALEAVLLSPYIQLKHHSFVFKMIRFLLDTQITEGKNRGAWPEYVAQNNVQTLTTGHAVSALFLSKKLITDDKSLENKIESAIKMGFDYLNSNQNTDGGWAIEPESDSSSRAFSTYFVIKGYIQNGFTRSNSKVVRNACKYLLSLRNEQDGGFAKSKEKGEKSDTCYTARIITVLLRANYCKANENVIKSAIGFIFRDITLKQLIKIKREQYTSINSPGMVVFHSNTPIDVMEALCLCNIYNHKTQKLISWILDTQEDNGGWYLGGSSNPEINENVITWTTNEGIYALGCCNKAFSEKRFEKMRKSESILKKVILLLLVVIIMLGYMNLSADNWLVTVWKKLPETVRKFFVFTLLGGLILNIFYNAIYDFVKKLVKGKE